MRKNRRTLSVSEIKSVLVFQVQDGEKRSSENDCERFIISVDVYRIGHSKKMGLCTTIIDCGLRDRRLSNLRNGSVGRDGARNEKVLQIM